MTKSEADAINKEIGRRIREAREQRGLTQALLAERIGFQRASITNLEKGRQGLLAHTLVAIAGELAVSPSSLIPEDAYMRRPHTVQDFISTLELEPQRQFVRSVFGEMESNDEHPKKVRAGNRRSNRKAAQP